MDEGVYVCVCVGGGEGKNKPPFLFACPRLMLNLHRLSNGV